MPHIIHVKCPTHHIILTQGLGHSDNQVPSSILKQNIEQGHNLKTIYMQVQCIKVLGSDKPLPG